MEPPISPKLINVFARDADGEVRCHEATLLQSEHWHEVQRVVQRRVLRYFRTHGLLDEADAHGMLSWRGSGGFSIDASVRIEGGECTVARNRRRDLHMISYRAVALDNIFLKAFAAEDPEIV